MIKIAEIETPEIFMYCLFSDTPRFSDSFLTDQMCHYIESALYYKHKVEGLTMEDL